MPVRKKFRLDVSEDELLTLKWSLECRAKVIYEDDDWRTDDMMEHELCTTIELTKEIGFMVGQEPSFDFDEARVTTWIADRRRERENPRFQQWTEADSE